MKDYSKISYVDRLRELDSIDCNTIIKERDVYIALEFFITMLTQATYNVAPEKEFKIKCSTEAWIDADVLELIIKRDRALF